MMLVTDIKHKMKNKLLSAMDKIDKKKTLVESVYEN